MSGSRRVLQLATIGSLVWALSGASCNDDPSNPAFEPPLRVIFTVPAELAQLEDNSPVDISIDFNRPVRRMAEMTLLLVPPPAGSDGDPFLKPSRQNITWSAVETLEGSRSQRLMIYSPEMLAPEILLWLTADPPPNAWFSGKLHTGSTDRRVDFCAIFALDAAGDFDPLDPVSFESETPMGFARPFELLTLEQEGDYQITQLEPGLDVFVVAIHDTNGDGRYSPLDDWWGYFRETGSSIPVTVTAWPVPLGPTDPSPRGDVDIVLEPPFEPAG